MALEDAITYMAIQAVSKPNLGLCVGAAPESQTYIENPSAGDLAALLAKIATLFGSKIISEASRSAYSDAIDVILKETSIYL